MNTAQVCRTERTALAAARLLRQLDPTNLSARMSLDLWFRLLIWDADPLRVRLMRRYDACVDQMVRDGVLVTKRFLIPAEQRPNFSNSVLKTFRSEVFVCKYLKDGPIDVTAKGERMAEWERMAKHHGGRSE